MVDSEREVRNLIKSHEENVSKLEERFKVDNRKQASQLLEIVIVLFIFDIKYEFVIFNTFYLKLLSMKCRIYIWDYLVYTQRLHYLILTKI